MRTKNVIAVGALVLLGAACGGTREVAQPTAFATGPISFDSASVSPGTGSLPTTSPGSATGQLLNGTASAELSGDLAGSHSFTALAPPALFSPPPGAMAVVWQTPAADETISITGPSFTGEASTSATLTLLLNVRNGDEAVILTSTSGECTIAIDQAVQGALQGSFACQRLVGTTATGELSVDATGAFSASG